MKFERVVYFETLTEAGVKEIDQIRWATTPFHRLQEYPDLLEGLKRDYDLADFDEAVKTLRLPIAPGQPLTARMLRKTIGVLQALETALERDKGIDYSPTSQNAVDVLIEARNEQLTRIREVVPLLRQAWAGVM